jgi:hypothetical protein
MYSRDLPFHYLPGQAKSLVVQRHNPADKLLAQPSKDIEATEYNASDALQSRPHATGV